MEVCRAYNGGVREAPQVDWVTKQRGSWGPGRWSNVWGKLAHGGAESKDEAVTKKRGGQARIMAEKLSNMEWQVRANPAVLARPSRERHAVCQP